MDIKKIFKGKGNKEESLPVSSPTASGDSAAPKEVNSGMDKISTLCKELDITPINLSKYKVPAGIIGLVPEELARACKVLPLAKFGNTLTIAISDPFDIVAIDSIKAATKFDVQLAISPAEQITQAINEYYNVFNLEKTMAEQQQVLTGEEGIEVMPGFSEENINVQEMTELGQKSQIVELVNNLIASALRKRSSDIHIEPYPDTLRLRYRIDGVMQEVKPALDKKLEQAIIARLKIMSKLDITQRRLPQDGRISLKLESKDIDLRVSVLPLVSGEKVVMRILEKGGLQVDLEKLGFSAYAFEAFTKIAAKPHGMMIITGPTGSGKSTTLYAILNRLNNLEKNLVTIEDPVEYQMKGITQIQVKPEIGLNFSGVLRAVLRQNPDIVMVGEIRDFETVDIAIKAALTGHLILSTLHTNDAPSTIVRLMNMGVEPFLISSTLSLIAAQRLCRKVCPQCKEPHEVSVAHLAGLPPDFKQPKATFYRGKGCAHCSHTGHFGRVAIVEALIIDDTLRQMILEKAIITKIREYGRSQGMKTLREDAMDKSLRGEISLEEVLRVTPEG